MLHPNKEYQFVFTAAVAGQPDSILATYVGQADSLPPEFIHVRDLRSPDNTQFLRGWMILNLHHISSISEPVAMNLLEEGRA